MYITTFKIAKYINIGLTSHYREWSYEGISYNCVNPTDDIYHNPEERRLVLRYIK